LTRRTAPTKADTAQRERDARLRDWERWLTAIDKAVLTVAFRVIFLKKNK